MIPKPIRQARASKPLRRGGKRGKRTSNRRKERLSLMKQCVILWSRWIKRHERCEFIGKFVGNRQHTQCGGALQAMHGFGKKAYPGVRFAAWNGFCGCASVHSYYTWRAPEWENVLRTEWGEELYLSRLAHAMETRKYDLAEVAQTYRAALAGVELFS